METFGYAGKILKVDLGSFTIKEEELDIEMAKKYLGGMGLGMRAAYDSIEPGTDPLSHENKIYLTAGALAGA
jgi:aldehyde:ferredoxin oxidoreductase